jgi:hypothetical protein
MDADEARTGSGDEAETKPVSERVYLHRQCGGFTQISGHDFLRLANPFAVAQETICCGCCRAVPIRQVEWADTGENVAAYRKRLRAEMPLGRRLFFQVLGPVAGALVGFLCGFAGGVLMIGRVGNQWLLAPGIIGGLVGAVGGGFLGAPLLPAHLMRMVWGLDYRGVP